MQVYPAPLMAKTSWQKELYKLLDTLPDKIKTESAEKIVRFIEQLLEEETS